MKRYIGLILLLILISFPLFSHLDSFPIFEWDESRLAANAVEMHQKGNNPLVPTFDYKPDMWNTKPPLLIWIQVLSIKLLGVSELALRLPSALAAVVLCLLLYWFFSKKLQKELLGFMVCMVLITSKGYVMLHGTRTCDYDSLLTLFTTAYCLFFYLYLKSTRVKYLYLSFFCIALAVLTKGVAGIFFTPALALYMFARKENLKIFRSVHLYSGILMLAILVGGYYMLREHYNPGYLKAVWENELGGRFAQVNEEHEGPPIYYLKEMLKGQYTIWMVPMMLGIVTGLITKEEEIRELTKFSFLMAAVLMLIISIAKTKLQWYSMPAFPWFAIFTGVLLYAAYTFVRENSYPRIGNTYILTPLFVIVAFVAPYINILNDIMDDKLNVTGKETLNMTYFLKDAKDGKHSIAGYLIACDIYSPNIDWYMKVFDYGPNTVKGFSWDGKPGSIVAASETETKDRLNKLFDTEVLRDYHGVTVYKITGYPVHK